MTLDSGCSGPTVAIMVGMHGNEQLGPMLWDWLSSLQIDRGRLELVLANPTAVEQNRRYINTNLNRRLGKGLNQFPEDQLARQIEAVLDKADALLDIHQYNDDMDRPFVITGPKGKDLASKLPAEYLLTGWTEFDDGASDDYMETRGKIGICFECGSVNRPGDYRAMAEKAVMIFLTELGLIEGDQARTSANQTRLKVVDIVKKVNDDFSFDRDYTTFDKLTPNQAFAKQGEERYIAKADQFLVFPRPSAALGDEVFTLASLE